MLGQGGEADAPLLALGRRYADSGRRRDACTLATSAASERVREGLRDTCSP